VAASLGDEDGDGDEDEDENEELIKCRVHFEEIRTCQDCEVAKSRKERKARVVRPFLVWLWKGRQVVRHFLPRLVVLE
jgi:hypothetical protein